jgi:hypothetical protein
MVRAGGAGIRAAPGHHALTSRASGQASRFAINARATQAEVAEDQHIANPSHSTPVSRNINIGFPVRGFLALPYSSHDPSRLESPALDSVTGEVGESASGMYQEASSGAPI